MGEIIPLQTKKSWCLIVKDRMIISDGYNGTPSGFKNVCEDENGLTHWYVLHAEANAILKLLHRPKAAKTQRYISPCLLVKIVAN